jgi:hypothetical protein
MTMGSHCSLPHTSVARLLCPNLCKFNFYQTIPWLQSYKYFHLWFVHYKRFWFRCVQDFNTKKLKFPYVMNFLKYDVFQHSKTHNLIPSINMMQNYFTLFSLIQFHLVTKSMSQFKVHHWTKSQSITLFIVGVMLPML